MEICEKLNRNRHTTQTVATFEFCFMENMMIRTIEGWFQRQISKCDLFYIQEPLNLALGFHIHSLALSHFICVCLLFAAPFFCLHRFVFFFISFVAFNLEMCCIKIVISGAKENTRVVSESSFYLFSSSSMVLPPPSSLWPRVLPLLRSSVMFGFFFLFRAFLVLIVSVFLCSCCC